jgi:hypothetical protein
MPLRGLTAGSLARRALMAAAASDAELNTKREGGIKMNSTQSPNITQVSFRTPGTDGPLSTDAPELAVDEGLAMLRSEIESLTQTIAELTSRRRRSE